MAWTDDRIDDLVLRIDRGFDEMRTEMRAMRTEMREMRTEFSAELRSEVGGLRTEMGAWQRQQAMIGWGIAAALVAQLLAFVITQA
jgi:hypothetical protein